MRHISWTVAGIVIVLLLAVFIDLPGTNQAFGRNVGIQKGIDIAGGVRVLECAKTGTHPSSTDMSTARDVINSRVSGGFGVSEPQVSVINSSPPCVSVEVPGVGQNKQQELLGTIGKTGFLALTDSGSTFLNAGTKVKLSCKDTACLQEVKKAGLAGIKIAPTNATANPPVLQIVVAGSHVSQGSAQVGFSSANQPEVTYSLDGSGSSAWCNYTTSHNNPNYSGSGPGGAPSAIVLDGKVVTDPNVQGPICQGSTQITGITSTSEAQQIATYLNYGALPVSLHVDSSEQVAASLGQQYVNDATKAGIIGMIIVILFMLIYYRLPGLLADVALLMYAAIVFAAFKYLGVTLTLAGIAGFILSIGMAVDANVLIFERMKEELRSGKTLGSAVEAGFRRAWPSIRDSNASTIITTVILFWFGHNFAATTITGFATTLFIGVVISLLTAVFVSHTFLRLLVLSGYARDAKFYGVEPEAATALTGGSYA